MGEVGLDNVTFLHHRNFKKGKLIGVSDVNNQGIMAWLDGSEPNFMNWDYYQKNFPGKKCGVIFTNFNWKYKPCNGARGFVCKKPLRGQ